MLLRCTSLLTVVVATTAQVYPNLRFTQWDQLDGSVRTIAEQLGYEQTSWNRPGSNPIESIPYARLSAVQMSGIAQLLPAETEQSWNCYIQYVQ